MGFFHSELKSTQIPTAPKEKARVRSAEDLNKTPIISSKNSEHSSSFENIKAAYGPFAGSRSGKRRVTVIADVRLAKVPGSRLKKVLSQCALPVISEE